MKITVLLFFVAMATGWSETVGQTCERISNKMCQGLGYNYTMFPNSVNHKSQNEAALEIHKYYPLIRAGCSKYLRIFACSVYMPACSTIPIPPCQLLCEQTKKDCEPLMKTFGFVWPKEFDCGIFAGLGGRLCISSSSATPHSSVCEEITVPMCKGIGYNYSRLPNMLNHTTQNEVALEVHQFFPLVQVKCSSYFRQFLCSVYTPQCTHMGATIPPCRSLCEESRRGCEPLMKKYGFTWPDKFNCSKFPVKGSGVICNLFDLQSDIKPTTKALKAPKVSPLPGFRKILTKVQGVLSSPNYPNPYPLGITYEWTIQLPDSYGLIKITIEKMRLEEDQNCFYDYVMIKDKMLNQVGRRHCGTYRSPYEVSVRGNKAIIIFVSDASTSKTGFSIKYRGLQADS